MQRWNTLDGSAPRIIAHRGASGYRPEHTLDGYALAAAQGADVLEPDLVLSRDRVLFARHDLGLARSTDIAVHAQFANRAREIAGQRDWWVSDFTADELDSLRAVQPFPERGRRFDGRLVVPRFAMLLDLRAAASSNYGRTIAAYPELKHPEYFRAVGLDPVAALHEELAARALLGPASPVWIQCFDHAVLREVKERCGNPCFALLENVPAERDSRDALLREIARWAQGVAPPKHLLWDHNGNDNGMVAAAHALGLQVHAWTFRDDRPPAPFASARDELFAAFALGVDALFCDFPDTAIDARKLFVAA
ncbi:MAG TPA: glycerophosphodiester phosphodiesterase family protein [Rhodanobacteraceae bacterium]|jgi:glycerophosphoryl diester phosphodiesterase|nr:glycerophosphodiester phosphodiesterase family protein [Rhodanobacteraceae bacterium]